MTADSSRSTPAGTVIVDASYGADDTAMSECRAALDPVLAPSQVLLPVPADGRGPELALYAARTRRRDIGVDAAMRDALRRLAVEDAASVRPGLANALARLVEEAGDENGGGIVPACNADGTSGAASRLIAQCERAAAPAIVFTGHLTPGTPAERLVRQGRALYRRWNVPRLSDNAELPL